MPVESPAPEETQVSEEKQSVDQTKPNEGTTSDGKLVVAEEIAHGRIAWPARKFICVPSAFYWT